MDTIKDERSDESEEGSKWVGVKYDGPLPDIDMSNLVEIGGPSYRFLIENGEMVMKRTGPGYTIRWCGDRLIGYLAKDRIHEDEARESQDREDA